MREVVVRLVGKKVTRSIAALLVRLAGGGVVTVASAVGVDGGVKSRVRIILFIRRPISVLGAVDGRQLLPRLHQLPFLLEDVLPGEDLLCDALHAPLADSMYSPIQMHVGR